MTEFMINDAMAFLTVVDEGSYAAAAKKWSLSSSVISKRITRLEQNLHVQLLQRTTRKILLTETGQIFYDRCKRIKAEINDAAADVLQHHQHPSGLVRINAPMSFGQVHLMPAINDFVRQNSDIKIELILGSQYSSFILNGLDLAIFIKDLPESNLLKSHQIAVRNMGVYGSPSYFAEHPIPRALEDLKNHNCLIYQYEPGGLGDKHEWYFNRGGHRIRIPVNGNLRINSSQALVKAAVQGIGLAKLSSFMVTDEIKSGKLISVLSEFCARDIQIHVAYPNQRYLPSKVKVFLDFLIERFSSEFYWNKNDEGLKTPALS
jgi:DNA-binding transcriptional LysR family regulator